MLRGKNIILRTVRESDIDEMFNLESEISERGDFDAFQLMSEPRYKADYRETGFWKEDFGIMLVTDLDGEIVGMISFFKSAKYVDGYEIGYKIYKKCNRGKGYMTEALHIFSAYMFSIKPIVRLAVNMFTDNIASRKIAEKCGYQYEGTMRKAVFCRGKHYDMHLFSLLRDECACLSDLLASI